MTYRVDQKIEDNCFCSTEFIIMVERIYTFKVYLDIYQDGLVVNNQLKMFGYFISDWVQ